MSTTSGVGTIKGAAWPAGSFILLLFAATSRLWGAAPELEFHCPATVADAATPEIMRDLAGRLIPIYQDPDPERYLANLSALQMVAGDYAAAHVSSNRCAIGGGVRMSSGPSGAAMMYDVYAHAKALETETRILVRGRPSTSRSDEVASRLSDHDAYAWSSGLGPPREEAGGSSSAARPAAARRHHRSGGCREAVWAYPAYEAYRSVLAVGGVARGEGRRSTLPHR